MNTSTALTILAESGTGTVIMGTLLSSIATLSLFAYLITSWLWMRSVIISGDIGLALFGNLIAAVLVAFLTPWKLAPFLMLPLISYPLAHLLFIRGAEKARNEIQEIAKANDEDLMNQHILKMRYDVAVGQYRLLQLDIAEELRFDPAIGDLVQHVQDEFDAVQGALEESEQARGNIRNRIEAQRDKLDMVRLNVPMSQYNEKAARRYRWFAASYVVVGCVVVAGSLSGSLWMPAEKLQVKGEKPQTAYVISRNGDWMTVMTRQGQIRRIDKDLVSDRQNCDLKRGDDRRTGVMFLLRRHPVVPDVICPP
ncbi:MAG TPA: hypothetical protein VM142_02095 [Acidimicrobiales bacterium]|nr:hypothetical protein [Acidimicrobiales bacterium]